MKKAIYAGILMGALAFSSASLAQVSMELEEACFMDVELTDYIVQVVENGSSSINIVDEQGASQIKSILDLEGNADLPISDKVRAVLIACSEGRILQVKNANIIDTQ
jgi:hypothetical protein